jgi:hypothetical protein
MWRRELFENVKWNSGQSNQEWRSDAVSGGHVRSKTKLLRADKWFVNMSVRILAKSAPRPVYYWNFPGGAAMRLK